MCLNDVIVRSRRRSYTTNSPLIERLLRELIRFAVVGLTDGLTGLIQKDIIILRVYIYKEKGTRAIAKRGLR